MTILITTPVAQFSVHHLAKNFEGKPMSQEDWTRMFAKTYPNYRVEIFDPSGCHYKFESGPRGLQPRIWTHTCVPYGLDIEAVHARFEARAACVLSDYEEPTDLATDPAYLDGRYRNTNVRAAWMMYLDQAIEHYLAKVLH